MSAAIETTAHGHGHLVVNTIDTAVAAQLPNGDVYPDLVRAQENENGIENAMKTVVAGRGLVHLTVRHRKTHIGRGGGKTEMGNGVRAKRGNGESARKERGPRRRRKRRRRPPKAHRSGGGTVSSPRQSQEFHTWLVEERKINPETISKDQNKKEFAKFMEDYNTATLPDEKYYNMESYNRRMSALRQGEFLPPPDDSYDPQADMKAIIGAHKKKAVDQESYLNREQLMELRKVQKERVEAGKMRQLGMEISQTLGVRMDGTAFDE
ncbi:hypothetical protein FB45DRAFT_894711 [Roridomyces roridus]|uniref:Uncharacterized protein n=1 Tax=Roridomyces roridus TaxID=1738132 RepID=A0AAD7CG91_9AGAR|nr:hypothetical protein FB45DRAFT_894711 [Roridomyces roridus]